MFGFVRSRKLPRMQPKMMSFPSIEQDASLFCRELRFADAFGAPRWRKVAGLHKARRGYTDLDARAR
jgi:hypothetical protein